MWEPKVSGGHSYLINRFCDSPSNGGPNDNTMALGALNSPGQQWTVCSTDNACTGLFLKITLNG